MVMANASRVRRAYPNKAPWWRGLEIDFNQLQIRKWYNPADLRVFDAYYNICLVLDDNVANQLCTDQGKGFADSDDKVTWDLPTENVRKVDLIFRDVATSEYSNFFSGQAKVRDLKIFYSDSPTSEGRDTITYCRVNTTWRTIWRIFNLHI